MSIYIHLINLIENSGPLEIPESREPWQRDYDKLVATKKLVISKYQGVNAYCLPPEKKGAKIASTTKISIKKRKVMASKKVESVIRNVRVIAIKLPVSSIKPRSGTKQKSSGKARGVKRVMSKNHRRIPAGR